MRVDDEVLAVLSRAQTEGPSLTLTGQLDRRLYERTNKVLEAAGGKWNRKARAHVFDGGAADAMEQIILTGEITVPQDFGYFPTPPDVVKRLLEIADTDAGMRVLEPSAGRGAIAFAAAAQGAIVDCYELLETNYTAIAADQRLNWVRHADFLKSAPENVYDRVVMNPPFAKQADIIHVTHAANFLKQDGLLVSVMSAGITFRDDKRTQAFRDLVRARGGSIEAVPDGAFKSSGTMVRTVIVTIPGRTGEGA